MEKEIERAGTFLLNITAFPLVGFGGAANATNGVDVIRRKASLVVENNKRGRSSSLGDVSRCYNELEGGFYGGGILVIFSILKEKGKARQGKE